MSAILRHAAAGYEEAITIAKANNIIVPGKTTDMEMDYQSLYLEIIKWVKDKTGIDLYPPLDNIQLNMI